jgi:hypothetical protein
MIIILFFLSIQGITLQDNLMFFPKKNFLHCKLSIGLMLNLTLGVSQPVKFSISPMLMLNLTLIESKKDYNVCMCVITSWMSYTIDHG